MKRLPFLIISALSLFILAGCYDPLWQSLTAVSSGDQCTAVTVTYTATNPDTEQFTHIIQIFQVVGTPDVLSAETDDILLNPSTQDGGYASKPEGSVHTYTIALDTPVPSGTSVYALPDSGDGPNPKYGGSRFSSVTVCNPTTAPAPLYVPNLGLIMITAAQAQPVYQSAAGELIRVNGADLWLPTDADNSGFDTYVVADVEHVDGRHWVGIFLGSEDWGWVPLDEVTPIMYIDGTE
jgi:hypothetical protein